MMKKQINYIISLLLLLVALQSSGQITETTTKVYSSLNPKVDSAITPNDMLHMNLVKPFILKADLTGGIIGNVTAGGEIKVEVYIYDENKSNGKGSLIYGTYINSNTTQYAANSYQVYIGKPDHYLNDFNSTTPSTDILKLIDVIKRRYNLEGSCSLEEWTSYLSEDDSNSTDCVRDNNNQPVIIEVTIQNATLNKFKLPVLGEFDAKAFFDLQDILRKYHNPKGHPNYTIIAAHRGYWKNHPENSLAAFQAAIDQKVDMVEVDLKLTKDGHLILAHDFQLGRLTNIPTHLVQPEFKDSIHQDYVLSSMDLKDIRPGPNDPPSPSLFLLRYPDESSTGTGTTTEVLPTFEEFLDLCKGKIMVSLDKIDKKSEMMLKAFEMVKDKGMLYQTVFQGGGGKPISYYTEAYGTYASKRILFTPAFFDDNLPTAQDYKDKIDQFINAGFHVPNCNINYRNEDDKFLQKVFDGNTKDLVEYLHSQNIRVAQFPQWAETQRGNYNPGYRLYNDIRPDIDRRTDWDWMLSKGADMLITDRLEVLVKLLEAKGLRQ